MRSIALISAAVLAAFVGVAHSYIGERYILIRLFRRGNLPDLFRNSDFTKRMLRLGWHVMSVFALGFAALLAVLASSPGGEDARAVARIISATFALGGGVSLVISKGRHASWFIFWAIAALAWAGQG